MKKSSQQGQKKFKPKTHSPKNKPAIKFVQAVVA